MDDLRHTLKEHGLRYSKPRAAILELFNEHDRHVSAEGLYMELKQRGEDISLSTVYLNLGVLKQAGLLRELHGPSGEALYDSNISPHHHLMCKGCGLVVDIPLSLVNSTPINGKVKQDAQKHAKGWQVDEPDFMLKGHCPNCQKA